MAESVFLLVIIPPCWSGLLTLTPHSLIDPSQDQTLRMPLTLYSEPGCSGSSKQITDSEVNLAKVGVKFPVKSALVDGNPFILFSEERYQGFLAYLEEGRYDELAALGLPADYKVASVKYKKESLASPQIKLFNSSSFAGKIVLMKDFSCNCCQTPRTG